MSGKGLRAEFTLGVGGPRQRPGVAQGRAPFAGKRPLLSPVDGFHPSPLVPRQ